MKGIYDIHCHIVPGVDDGAKDLKTSVRMLQKEYDDGVRNIIATPHFRYDMFEPSLEQVKKQFLRVRKAAAEIGEDGIQMYLGCELHSSMDMTRLSEKRGKTYHVRFPLCVNGVSDFRRKVLYQGTGAGIDPERVLSYYRTCRTLSFGSKKRSGFY